MNEDELRGILEQIDPDGKIPDDLKEEIVDQVVRAGMKTAVESELRLLDTVERVVETTLDWRVNAANAARNIGKDLNIL